MNKIERKETEKLVITAIEEYLNTHEYELIEDQHSMQFDGCLALLKQLKEIIADCEIRFESYNDKYEANYEKYKEVRTLLTPYLSVWKKAEACRTIKIILRRNKLCQKNQH